MSEDSDFEPVSVTLPERYWIVVLGLVENAVQDKVGPRLEELRRLGVKPEDLTSEEKALLTGVLTARAQIVDTLIGRGVIKEEARERLGLDNFYKQIEEANQQANKKRKN
ncbi:MAG TPA: hypothetical protein VF707_20655 [Ardenticatenaceae bacterium]|jgi:hypothetical protein